LGIDEVEGVLWGWESREGRVVEVMAGEFSGEGGGGGASHEVG
jgi:hypothetical protein